MSPERQKRVWELFEQARALPAEQRAAWLREQCAGEPGLVGEILSLMKHDEQAPTEFLRLPNATVLVEQAPAGPGAGDPATQTAGGQGEVPVNETPRAPSVRHFQIEGYEITHELSRGGQGVVYQAIQKATRRKVAVKVLREGPYASNSSRRRFERELALVASLRHPNIISVFHSGTTPDGWQFFVMDYVRGEPLNDYVHQKKLTLEKVLELFLAVCDGIQHAHQKGVVHRDLKQTNILVDGGGAPRILDFGLAKLVAGSAETLLTLTREILGTPAYMAPEQFSGNPDAVDTRSDIYGLGVILFELLTGHLPYVLSGSLSDFIRRVTESDPTPPTRAWTAELGVNQRATRRLRVGECPIDEELSTIVLKAIAKEQERRYQSVGELAADIRRYLAGEPVAAKRDSQWYVLRKMLRRHRVVVGTATSFVALLILSCLALMAMYGRQLQLQKLATDHAQRATTTYDFLRGIFTSIDPREARFQDESVRSYLRSLLDSAGDRIAKELGGQPAVAAALHETLARTYQQFGYTDPALRELEQAVRIQRDAGASGRQALINDLILLADLRREKGIGAEALSALREALVLSEAAEPHDGKDAVRVLRELTRRLIEMRELEEAERIGKRQLDLARATFGEVSSEASCALTDLATVLQYRGDLDGAEQMLRKVLEMRRRMTGAESAPVLSGMNNLANLMLQKGRPSEAADVFREAHALAKKILHPRDWLIAATESGYAACLIEMCTFDEAERPLLEARTHLATVLGDHDVRTEQTVRRIVQLYEAWGKPEAAAEWRARLAETRVAADGVRP